MNSRMTDAAGIARGGTRWDAVAFGWVVALLAGIAISLVLRQLYGVLAELPVERGEFTAGVVIVSLVAGFLSYLIGGFAAARSASRAGGRHGALTAVFGLIVGIVLTLLLAVFGVVFAEGVAVPPAAFEPFDIALGAALILFLVNLFGGYVGGKLGEPSPDPDRFGR